MHELWTAVDVYTAGLLLQSDDTLDHALRESAAAGLPAIQVSPLQGKFLQMLAQIRGARRILEIGTLGGYSTIWLARALPADGRLITLEAEPKHAEVARRNLSKAGLEHVVEVRLGKALDTLPNLAAEAGEPFDFIFVDADKANMPGYFEWAVKLSAPGAVIVLDNVIRDGRVTDANSGDANIAGVRRAFELIADEPRVRATAIQTVGSKGYDGFAVALVQ